MANPFVHIFIFKLFVAIFIFIFLLIYHFTIEKGVFEEFNARDVNYDEMKPGFSSLIFRFNFHCLFFSKTKNLQRAGI